jgi:hypothetical protein
MIDPEILGDRTIRRVIVGSFAGVILGMLLAIVVAAGIPDNLVKAGVFFAVFAIGVGAVWQWAVSVG